MTRCYSTWGYKTEVNEKKFVVNGLRIIENKRRKVNQRYFGLILYHVFSTESKFAAHDSSKPMKTKKKKN